MTEISRTNEPSPSSDASAADIKQALDAVVDSQIFAASPRLRAFLRYVVDESLSGRSEQISGKSIAVDVYHRELDNDDGGLNLVRVEARRLRRLLDDYYNSEGSGDRLQIQMALGGYRPSFTTRDSDLIQATGSPAEPLGALQRVSTVLPTVGLAGALVLAGVVFWPLQPVSPPGTQTEKARLQALREHSVPTLQAANVAQQARGLLFPVFEIKRQQLALEMFRYAIELEPNIPHGYAGAAQVLATLSVLSRDPQQRAELVKNARDMADRAMDLDPSNAWGHAALGWTLGAEGDFRQALKHARLAIELAPEDGHVLDLVGITAIRSNQPELAAQVSDPDRPRSGVGRFGARNIWGVSQYMLGNYEAVIDAFRNAPSEGAPVSAPSLVFLAVAYDHLDNVEDARLLVNELSSTWPDFPTAFLVGRIFHQDSKYGQDILNRLAKYDYDLT